MLYIWILQWLQQKLVIRIRIGSGFNWVCGSWSGLENRNLIQEGKNGLVGGPEASVAWKFLIEAAIFDQRVFNFYSTVRFENLDLEPGPDHKKVDPDQVY